MTATRTRSGIDAASGALRGAGIVGRGISQIDVEEKLTGRTQYVGDLTMPGMLYGAIVRSPVPHGTIRSIDTSRARRLPGVRAVVTAADAPPVLFGPYTDDWEILAREKVRFVGDEIAAVAAVSEEIAREAAALVTVEIEPLPAVFDPVQALEPGAPLIWDHRPGNVSSVFEISRGDVDTAFAGADHVLARTFETSKIYHGYLEPIGAIAQYVNGRYVLHAPSHIPYRARITYATGLGVSLDRVRLIVPPIGGSFGAKYEMNTPLIAALLAREAGAPVRIVFDREEDAAYAHPRPPFVFHEQIAYRDDGTFLGRKCRVVGVAGGRTYWSPTVLATAVHRVDALYNFGTMSGIGHLAYTNENPTTCMRGFGNAESLFGIEQMVDEIAESLGRDPSDLRLQNIVREGETTMHGWHISSSKLPECLSRVEEMSHYSTRRRPVPPTASERVGVLRGTGIAIAHHVSGYRTILADYDGSSAILRIGGDFTVSLYIGEPDIGQGLKTIVAQIVAEQLGLPVEQVSVMDVDSDLSPDSVGTLASRAATMAGMAVVAACSDAVTKLTDFLAARWNVDRSLVDWDGATFGLVGGASEAVDVREAVRLYAAANCGLPLLATGVHHPATEIPDATKYGNPCAAYPFAAHVAEVEVDCATGLVRVVGYWAAHDSGTILNPSTARGQVVGGVAQGIGWALTEQIVSVDGRVRNPNFLDYRIPGAGDIPEMEVDFVEGYEPNGPLGGKSLAEVALDPVIAAIANAVYNATGIRSHRLPISGEVLWEQLRPREVAAP